MSRFSRLRASHIKLLVEHEDPIEAVWKILSEEIWTPSDNLEDYFKKEEEASNFEYELSRIFFEIYDYLYKSISESSRDFKLPLIIMDGMSIREGNLLVRDLKSNGYNILKYSYTLSALPSITLSFREILPEKYKKYIEVRGEIPPHIDQGIPIWVSYPDQILHHAREVLKPHEAYEKTRNLILELLKQMEKGSVVTITSDHGYINAGAGWPVESEVENILNKIFKKGKGYRFVKLEEVTDRAELERLSKYVFVDEEKEYCYVKGRYIWFKLGKDVITHGGLSLMENIVPYIEVEI